MKKVLIISMYYSPLNLIPVSRMEMFRQVWGEAGYEVDVLTRSYETDDLSTPDLTMARRNSTKSYQTQDKYGCITYLRYQKESRKLKFSNKLPPGVRGWYNMNQIDVFHHDFFDRVEEHLTTVNAKYDTVFLSYGPPIILKIARALKQVTPQVILDFRDSYITEVDRGWLLKRKSKILNKILGSVHQVTVASSGITDIMVQHTDCPCPVKEVWNGYHDEGELSDPDSAVLAQIRLLKEKGKRIALHAGSLYPGQNIKAIQEVLHEDGGFEQVFLGLDDPSLVDGQAVVLPRVSKKASFEACVLADVLMLPVWEGRYTGFNGKLLQYLFSGSLTLCGPDPQSDLQEILHTSNHTMILGGNVTQDAAELGKAMKRSADAGQEHKKLYSKSGQEQKILDLLNPA